MNKKIIVVFLALGAILMAAAQTDPAALSILDKFSDKALAAPSISIKFSLLVDDAIEDTQVESEGEIIIKGDRYKLTIPENIVWYNGEAIYTLVPDVQEVTITEPDPDNETFFSSPSLLFTLYREDYKIRLVAENAEGSTIDLYPEKLDAEFNRVRLHIDKSYKLISAEYKRKDGISMLLLAKDYNLVKKYKDDFFVFDEKKYRNADIIDMRF